MRRIHLDLPKESGKKCNKDEPIWTEKTLIGHMFSRIKLNMDIINSERFFVELWDLWEEIKATSIRKSEEEIYAIVEKAIKGLFFLGAHPG